MAARYDVAVVGAGPAGSIAALQLARQGARVALIDKSEFPRAKACGDLVGPRGVALLQAHGVAVAGPPASDMYVEGPAGRRVRLPAFPGRSYPGHALVCPRTTFDAALRSAALDAGAEGVQARVTGLASVDGHTRLTTAGNHRVDADHVVGADGALSVVAEQAGLVRSEQVLWGFALRGYLPAVPDLPMISLRDERPGRAYPGYGWLFPGVDGRANVGIGVGLLDNRSGSRRTRADLTAYVEGLVARGLLPCGEVEDVQGGWLKMGTVGTVPAAGRVLLVGDAAGLVNPLQGEGIGPAMESAVLAARAICRSPGDAAAVYRQSLADRFSPYLNLAAPLQAALLRHPAVVSVGARALTSAPVGRRLAGTWSLTWNDLLDGATPRPALTAARLIRAAAGPLARRSRTGRLLAETFLDSG